MSGTQQPKWTWWEKTVEYSFVKRVKFLKTAPLDGNHEKAGDAILRNKCGRYYLVEFKKGNDNESINREIGKFGYKEPEKLKKFIEIKYSKLISEAGFHFVIFGSLSPEQELELIARKYWDYLRLAEDKQDKQDKENGLNDDKSIRFDMFEEAFKKSAVDQDKFMKYIQKLISLKEGSEGNAGNSGSGGFSFDNVLAVNEEGEFCTIMDMKESAIYQDKLLLDNKKDLPQNEQHSGSPSSTPANSDPAAYETSRHSPGLKSNSMPKL